MRAKFEVERSCDVEQMKCFDAMQRKLSGVRGIWTLNGGDNYLLPLKKIYDRLQHTINMASPTHSRTRTLLVRPILRNYATRFTKNFIFFVGSRSLACEATSIAIRSGANLISACAERNIHNNVAHLIRIIFSFLFFPFCCLLSPDIRCSDWA